MSELKIHFNQQVSFPEIVALVVCRRENSPLLQLVSSFAGIIPVHIDHWERYGNASSQSLEEPQLIVVEQCWSDQFVSAEIDHLFARWPLSRVVVVYGRLSESDGRTRDYWPLAVRIPFWQLKTRIHAEIEILRNQKKTLPLTADRDEIAAFQAESWSADDLLASDSLVLLGISIYSPDHAWGQMLEFFCREAGVQQVCSTNDWRKFENALVGQELAAILLMDVDPLRRELLSWFSNLSAKLAGRQVIRLISSHPDKLQAELHRLGMAFSVYDRFDLRGIIGSVNMSSGLTK